MQCQRLHLTGTLDGATVLDFEVPAYTRTVESFTTVTDDIRNDYLDRSHKAGVKPSLADYALFLLRQAHDDPTSQEEDG